MAGGGASLVVSHDILIGTVYISSNEKWVIKYHIPISLSFFIIDGVGQEQESHKIHSFQIWENFNSYIKYYFYWELFVIICPIPNPMIVMC